MSIDFETSEQQNQLPTYQKVEDIELREDEGADLEVWVRDGEDPVAKAREQLELNNWWLSARWQEKGLPQEQFVWQMGDKKVNIFNFGSSLLDQNIADFKTALDSLAAKTNFGADGLDYILIDNEDKPHPYANAQEGQLIRGASVVPQKAIVLFPTVINEKSYRDGQIGTNISGIQGIIPHEMGHQFEYKSAGANHDLVTNIWHNDYGFGQFNPDKRMFELTNPDETVSDYAKLNTSDDFCESLVAALYNPDRLKEVSPKKLEFMQNVILKEGQVESAISKVDVELPRLDSPTKYRKRVMQKIKLPQQVNSTDDIEIEIK